jgi:hypothetical protein
MVFTSLGPNEKDAFFSLLDESVSSLSPMNLISVLIYWPDILHHAQRSLMRQRKVVLQRAQGIRTRFGKKLQDLKLRLLWLLLVELGVVRRSLCLRALRI